LYILVADYHTHTRYSHGKGTILENVEAARKKGLKKLPLPITDLTTLESECRFRSQK
jgi:predicted metal-dependent phosphoesterase TrpH